MRYRSAAAVVATGVLLVGGVSACSSSSSPSSSGSPSAAASVNTTPNGVDQLEPAEILSKSKAAVESASSATIKASDLGESSGLKSMDLTLTKTGAQGTIDTSTTGQLQIIVDGQTAYMKGDDKFYDSFGGAEAAKLMSGKWLSVPASDPRAQQFTQMTLDNFMSSIFGDVDATKLTKVPVKDVGGVQCVGLQQGDQGTVWIATTGEPYPMALEPPTGQPGSVTMTNWNAPVTITPPPADQVVDVSKLTGSSGSPSPAAS